MNQSTIEKSPLIHGQINGDKIFYLMYLISYIIHIIYYISMVESNKFDNVYTKFETFLFDPIFRKQGRVLNYQITLVKNIQSKF